MADSDSDEFIILDQAVDQEQNSARFRPQSPGTLHKIFEWLEPTAYDDGTSEYARHLTSHLKGTGDWLAETDEYRRWHDGSASSSHLLWIKAAPGTGKSVIAAHQRAHLAVSERAVVLYFFFRYIIATNRTPLQLVRDWIAQLLPFSPSLQKRIKEEYLDKNKLLSNVTFGDLWGEFRSACKAQPRIYCFVDALDEMSPVQIDSFTTHLLQLSDIPACKVFVTSRPIPCIVASFRNTPVISFTLGPENMSGDISTYVDHRVEKDMARYIDHRLDTHDANLGDHETRAAVKPIIQSTLQKKAQGSFLYSKLILDNVLDALRGMGENVSTDKVRQVLNSLPTGLAGMYGDMLRDHARRSGTSPELQQNILRWVTHSERPLRMLELATVLASVMTASGSEAFNPADTKALVRTACGPLLEIMPSDVVGPVHHSFTEYLTLAERSSDGARNVDFIDSESTHRYILEQCLTYLVQLDLPAVEKPPMCDDDSVGVDEYDHLKLKHSFFEYATTHWPSHARKCGHLDLPIMQLLDRFLEKSRETRRIWVQTAVKARLVDLYLGWRKEGEPLWSDTVTTLHVAAFVGLPDYAEHLLSQGSEVNATTRLDATPLSYAASKGHASTLDILLRAGADPLHVIQERSCPLVLAAEAGHADCVDRLMQSLPAWGCRNSGNRFNSPWGLSVPKLSANTHAHGDSSTSKTRSTAVVQTAREGSNNDADPDPKPNSQLASAMRQAVFHRQSKSIDILLKYLSPDEIGEVCNEAMDRGATEISLTAINIPSFDVNLPLNNNNSSSRRREVSSLIGVAVSSANVACVRALLRRNARLTSSSTQNNGDENLLHLLITKNGSSFGRTSDKDLIAVAELLVEAGTPVDEVNTQSQTPLFRVRSRHAVAETLLRLGADTTTAAGGDSTPLHDIAGEDEEGMKFWIRYGFDINARDALGRTPLHVGLLDHRGSQDIVQRLKTMLALGADPNLRSPDGLAPLHMCHTHFSRDNQIKLYEMLLEAGADPNARDLNGQTPLMTLRLHRDEQCGSECAHKVLIDAGADPAARNVLGETAFLANIRRGWYCEGDVKSGPQWNSDIHVLSNNGSNAALLFCMHPTRLKQMNDLAEAGLDFKFTDQLGNTALHNMALVERPCGQRGKKIKDHDFLEMLKRLIEMGVDPDHKNLQAQSPLHFAVVSDESVMIDWLLQTPERRKMIDEADFRGVTALHVAACMSATRVLSLIDRGADPLRLTKTGQSALHLAAVARRGDVIAVLLACTMAKQKVFVNLADGSGCTALHYAARSGRHEIVKLLLDAGADPNVRDMARRAPLNACADFRKEEQAWIIARETIQNRQGPFIPTKSRDYGLQQLETNVFNFAPIALIRPWEAMARELSSAAKAERAFLHAPKKPSLRQSVKYLLSHSAQVILPEQVNGCLDKDSKFGGFSWDPKSAIVDALIAASTGHDGLLGELLSFLEAETGCLEKLYAVLEYGVGKIQLTSSRDKDLYLKQISQSDEAVANLRYVFEMFMAEDRADLAAALIVASESRKKIVNRSTPFHFWQLIDGALSDAVALCVREFERLRIPVHDFESDYWPRSLQDLPSLRPVRGCCVRRRNEAKPGFKSDHELFAGLLNGALLRACQTKTPNHQTVVVLTQGGMISQREKMFSLAAMATAPEPWNLETIEYLVGDGADVDAQDPNGLTLLMRACHNSGREHPLKQRVVKLLLNLGADTTILDARQRSCLDFTTDIQTIKLLLRHGVSTRRKSVQTVLLMALESQNVDLVRLLVEHGIDLTEFETETSLNISDRTKVDRLETSPKSSEEGHDENRGVLKHADALAPVSLLEKICDSSRHLQSDSHQVGEIVQILLGGGADPFLPSSRSGVPVLHQLLAQGTDATSIIARSGIDLERRDGKDRTLLLAAAEFDGIKRFNPLSPSDNMLTNLEALLTLNANILAIDNDGNNILHLCALGCGTSDVVRKILDRQDSAELVNARNHRGQRPVQLSLEHHNWESAQVLVKHGADMTIVDNNGKTPFHYLVSQANCQRGPSLKAAWALIEKLIYYIELGPEWEEHASLTPLIEGEERNIDINAVNMKGEPPLFSLLRQPLSNTCTSNGPSLNKLDLRYMLASHTSDKARPDSNCNAKAEPSVKSGNDTSAKLEPAVNTEVGTDPRGVSASTTDSVLVEIPVNATGRDESIAKTSLALLLRAGLTLDVKSRDGRGALHAFASYRRSPSYGKVPSREGELIKAMWDKLVEAGLDPYAEDDEQRSALDVAAACGNLEILE